jgi:flagellar basal-body rod modification protein FlgD
MITSTTLTGSLTGTSGTSTVARGELDKNAFLTLLVTQLRNQDPMSPLQPHEFAAQLASFTSVEELTKVNENLADQTQSVRMAEALSKTSFSAALVGRTIIARGDQVTIPSSGEAKVRVDVGSGGGAATLKLLDDKGNVVTTRDLGQIREGEHTLTLPDDLPAGTYHYKIEVKGDGNKSVSVTTYTSGVVSGVSFENGEILLCIGDIKVPLETLEEVAQAGGNGKK